MAEFWRLLSTVLSVGGLLEPSTLPAGVAHRAVQAGESILAELQSGIGFIAAAMGQGGRVIVSAAKSHAQPPHVQAPPTHTHTNTHH